MPARPVVALLLSVLTLVRLPAQTAPTTIPVDSPAFTFSPGNWTGDAGRVGHGYRARLFDRLNKAHANYLFVGITDINSNDAMKAAGQQSHNGFGSWRIDGLLANIDGNHQPGGDPNVGGFFIAGDTGALRRPAFRDVILLLAGTNDLGSGVTEAVLEQRMTALLGGSKRTG